MNCNAKLKCAQLQIPGTEKICLNQNENTNLGCAAGKQSIADPKELFEENVDNLKNYSQMMNRYNIKIKSFSTADVQSQIDNNNNGNNNLWNFDPGKRSWSDCDLTEYYQQNNNNDKTYAKDYITYSCSTLAICGDTINSSQLPSPQAQSFRQLNSIIFSDLDLAKSINKKLINVCIKRRFKEFTKVVNQSALSENEKDNIGTVSSNIIIKPLKISYDYFNEDYSTGNILINVVNYEQNEVKFSKQDKEKFVLNWLQTVEPGIVEQN